MKKLFVFDLDGTLADSKSSLTSETAILLSELLNVIKVAVISGGSWHQFQSQLLTNLPKKGRFENLSLLPTCGTQYYVFNNGWTQLYAEDLNNDERALIVSSLEKAYEESGVSAKKVYGDVIEDRGSQITLSALGQDAPLTEKSAWDPEFVKRKKITALLKPLLPGFAIHFGGTTSIDVTRPGVDKSYGIGKLHEHLNIPLSEMIFAGNAIFEGGNDFPVQQIGVDSILVAGPSETNRVIQTAIACLGDGSFAITAPDKSP